MTFAVDDMSELEVMKQYIFHNLNWHNVKYNKSSRVPKRFVLISCVFMTICDYKAFPKDLGMGVGVGNVVIGVWGRNMTSAQ